MKTAFGICVVLVVLGFISGFGYLLVLGLKDGDLGMIFVGAMMLLIIFALLFLAGSGL